MILLAAFLLAAGSAQSPVCVEPSSARLTARDLAAAVPAFASLPGDRVLAWAPQPGFTRTVTPAEMNQWLGKEGAQEPVDRSLCIGWQMVAPEAAKFEAAMRRELPDGAALAVMETSQFSIPAKGELHFPWSGVQSAGGTFGAAEAAIWRGYVEYASGAKFPVWAKVDVRIPMTRVVAAVDLGAGATVEAAALRTEMVMAPAATVARERSLEESAIAGRVTRRPIRAGSVVSESALNRRVDVKRGDPVRVKVRSGGSSIGFDGTALAAAALGDSISVKVTDTGKTVRAVVSGPSEATIVLPGEGRSE